jgi:hypothetical protein
MLPEKEKSSILEQESPINFEVKIRWIRTQYLGWDNFQIPWELPYTPDPRF